jgi:hypothetical protein
MVSVTIPDLFNSQEEDFAVFQMSKCNNLNIKDAACCKGTYTCLRLGRGQGGNMRDTVAHVASSDLGCRSVLRLSVRI